SGDTVLEQAPCQQRNRREISELGRGALPVCPTPVAPAATGCGFRSRLRQPRLARARRNPFVRPAARGKASGNERASRVGPEECGEVRSEHPADAFDGHIRRRIPGQYLWIEGVVALAREYGRDPGAPGALDRSQDTQLVIHQDVVLRRKAPELFEQAPVAP